MCVHKFLSCCCSSCCCRKTSSQIVQEETINKYEMPEFDKSPEVDQSESSNTIEADETGDEESLKEPDPICDYIFSKFEPEIKETLMKETKFGEQCRGLDIVLVGFKSQFVAGTDYFLKIFEPVSQNYYHIRIYESLQGDLLLQRMSGPKRLEDPIEYF